MPKLVAVTWPASIVERLPQHPWSKQMRLFGEDELMVLQWSHNAE